MKTRIKENCTITEMTFEETGLMCPAELCKMKPLLRKGYNTEACRNIMVLVEKWGMSLDEAIETREKNQAAMDSF